MTGAVPWPRGLSADGEELGPALSANLFWPESGAAVELLNDRAFERANGRIRIAMGAAKRLGHNAVDDSEPLLVSGGDLHRLGRFGSFVGGPPQDRCAAFGGD